MRLLLPILGTDASATNTLTESTLAVVRPLRWPSCTSRVGSPVRCRIRAWPGRAWRSMTATGWCASRRPRSWVTVVGQGDDAAGQAGPRCRAAGPPQCPARPGTTRRIAAPGWPCTKACPTATAACAAKRCRRWVSWDRRSAGWVCRVCSARRRAGWALLERGSPQEQLLASLALLRLGDRGQRERVLSFQLAENPEVRRLLVEHVDGESESCTPR